MTRICSLATATAVTAFLLMGTTFAQTPAPAPRDATKTETKAPAEVAAERKQRSAVSLECSKQADAKALKGKERRKFRRECKKEKAPAAQPASK
jgi:psiF repeat